MRLRAFELVLANGLNIIFQFLLVRLRVRKLVSFNGKRVISIPSGAIKRKIEELENELEKRISIPSGAIKSFTFTTQVNYSVRFQFLLVRLRDNIAMPQSYVTAAFQFLLVRLRE